jgi:hypothetical protein
VIGIGVIQWIHASISSPSHPGCVHYDSHAEYCRDEEDAMDLYYSRRAAQAALNADRHDPNYLDADHDGIACERNP